MYEKPEGKTNNSLIHNCIIFSECSTVKGFSLFDFCKNRLNCFLQNTVYYFSYLCKRIFIAKFQIISNVSNRYIASRLISFGFVQ